ncbi:ferritin-like domain-containing protein [Natronorubrum sp. FCH18a]|uniref:YciE/YciF ferroxidase family protein n=1 Tax=Natronorubrum sp. FCH18a TaxID=3447018 RepID=UPI003F51A76A
MSTATTTPRDALTAQLERLYYIERTLQSELRTLATDVSIDSLDDLRALECREQLQYVIDGHREETETHLERIERAFDALGAEPDSRPVPELDGLIADKEAFNNVVLNDALRPLYYIQTVLQLEAIECTVYETTMALATAVADGETPKTSREGDEADDAITAVIDALQDNYDDERQVRTELESLFDGEAVETLLASSPVDDAARESLDRSWRENP